MRLGGSAPAAADVPSRVVQRSRTFGIKAASLGEHVFRIVTLSQPGLSGKAVKGWRPSKCTLDGRPWDRTQAGLHYLWWCARLAKESDVTPVQQRITAALTFAREVQQASVVLDRRSEPRHLEAWSQVVG